MFEQEIEQYDRLVAQYLEQIAKPMGDLEFRRHSEILFSCHSCGIEGSSFSVDDTRALFEQGLGYYPGCLNARKWPTILRLMNGCTTIWTTPLMWN